MQFTKDQSQADAMRTVQLVVEQQVSGRVSVEEAEKQWRKVLQLPPEAIVGALTIELAIGKYQRVPTCSCCGR